MFSGMLLGQEIKPLSSNKFEKHKIKQIPCEREFPGTWAPRENVHAHARGEALTYGFQPSTREFAMEPLLEDVALTTSIPNGHALGNIHLEDV